MTNPRTIQPDSRTVIVGVDTHTHVHVAVAIDTWGIRLGDRSCAADSDGYHQLITWAERHGRVALLHESSLARTMPTGRILTCRCDTTLVGRGRSSD